MASHEGFGYDTGIAEEEDLLAFGVRRSLQLTHGIDYIVEILGDSFSKDFSWHFPSGMEKIIDAFPSLLPDKQSILISHTRLPFYERFLEPDAISKYRKSLLKNHVKAINQTVNAGRLIGRMAICIHCRDERPNFAIWDRLFLLPGIYSCDIHQVPLVTFCGKCNVQHIGIKGWRPPYSCNCPSGLEPVAALNDKQLHISNFVTIISRQFLQNKASNELNGKSIMAAINRQLVGTRFSPASLLRATAYEMGRDDFLRPFLIEPTTFNRISSSHYEPLNNPIHILVLAALIFGNEDTLLQAVLEEQSVVKLKIESTAAKEHLIVSKSKTVLDTDAPADVHVNTDLEQEILTYRTELEAIFERHKPPTRTEAWRISRAAPLLIILKKLDRQWLNSFLPQRKKKPPIGLNVEANRQLIIASIYARHKAILETDPYSYIRPTHLVKDSGLTRSIARLLQYPDIKAALVECCHTEEKWQRQLAGLFIEEVRRIDPAHRFTNINRYLHESRPVFTRKLNWAKFQFQKELS